MSISSTTTTNSYLSTPGEILREEFMEPYGISAYRLARATGLSETAIGEIVKGKRAITVRTAWLLAEALRTTPQFWLNLQSDYDLLSFDAGQLTEVEPLIPA
ncbi:MAG: HigA family addiction module antitoxin [Bifidobacterium sp.]|nr:HigA family addiction module antitoxin [Bifidobacterium sp.]